MKKYSDEEIQNYLTMIYGDAVADIESQREVYGIINQLKSERDEARRLVSKILFEMRYEVSNEAAKDCWEDWYAQYPLPWETPDDAEGM